MLKVGLTGGLACGKSFVGEALAALGCHLIRADDLGHRVLLPGGAAYEPVLREFGPAILDKESKIDRARLAAEVFEKPVRLAALNRLVHPAVIALEEETVAGIAARDPHGIAVVEAAILVETGSWRRFDRLILLVCEEWQQVERAVERGTGGRDQVVARIRRQMPAEEKQKYADYVIDTSGDKEDTLRQTRAVYEDLRRLAK